jgi:hypothetical protein
MILVLDEISDFLCASATKAIAISTIKKAKDKYRLIIIILNI